MNRLSRRAVAASGVVLGVAAWVVALRWAGTIVGNRSRGFDVTDEAFYLAAVDSPRWWRTGVTDFAYYLHPLWLLVGRDIGRFRVVGLGLLWASAAAVGFEVCNWSGRNDTRGKRLLLLFVTLGFAGAGVSLYYVWWLVTPSYNLLALCLVVLIAVVTVAIVRTEGDGFPDGFRPEESEAREPPMLWTYPVLGALVVLTTGTKLTAALAALVPTLALLTLSGWRRTWRVRCVGVLAGGIGGLLIHSAAIGGLPWRNLDSWEHGADYAARLAAHPARQVWEVEFVQSHVLPWLWRFAVLCAIAFVVRRLVRSPPMRSAISTAMILVIAWSMWDSRPGGGIGSAVTDNGWWWSRFTSYSLLALTLTSARWSRLLLVGPLVSLYALAVVAASNNGFIRSAVLVVGLLVIGLVFQAVLVASVSRSWQYVLGPVAVVAAAFVSLTWTILDDAQRDPYRLYAPLAASDVPVRIGELGVLRTTAAVAAYVEWLDSLAEVDGSAGCMLNLEGGTPAAGLVTGLRSAGSPWIIGGYPGSTRAAHWLLAREDCLADGPFLLLEAPDAVRSIPRPEWIGARCGEPVSTFEFESYDTARIVASMCEPVAPTPRATSNGPRGAS